MPASSSPASPPSGAALAHALAEPLLLARHAVAELAAAQPGQPAGPRAARAVAQAQVVVDGLLRLERARWRPAPEDLDVAAVLRDAARRARARRDGAGTELEASVPDAVRADPQLLGAALEELLLNVADHAGPWPRATAWTDRRGAEVLLGVDDAGPGIPPALREEAVEPFRRLTATARGRQAGCGLAVVAAVAESAGGRLELGATDAGGLRAVLALPATGLPAGGAGPD